ncbi:hypothetical protein FCL51_11775 [Elizabethkingia anophelis]|uniref:hypothetical protein n=1 Tax=Elizabethkingia anophelis TaxID=1117645 RepID=UPI001365E82D|nr:hypothetical protein [Elizabethkingia anophelis]MVW83197.1 hypothetical protein [Elizabethkingia anophelis]
MIKVNKIEWLSKEANEAEVYLSDDNFNIICFAHPFDKNIGDLITQPLYTLNTKEVDKLSDEDKIFMVESNGDNFEYRLTGQVINKENNYIRIGDFTISLDISLPNDIEEGDFISCTCDRVDL